MIPKKSDNGKAKRKLGSATFFDSVLGSVTTKRLKNTALEKGGKSRSWMGVLLKAGKERKSWEEECKWCLLLTQMLTQICKGKDRLEENQTILTFT